MFLPAAANGNRGDPGRMRQRAKNQHNGKDFTDKALHSPSGLHVTLSAQAAVEKGRKIKTHQQLLWSFGGIVHEFRGYSATIQRSHHEPASIRFTIIRERDTIPIPERGNVGEREVT